MGDTTELSKSNKKVFSKIRKTKPDLLHDVVK